MPLLPVPLPDELVSSLIARGARENGLSSKGQMQDAFGDSRSYHSFLFADSLKRIAVLSGQSAEKLLTEHTVFRYATAFMPRRTQDELAAQAIENTARGRMNFISTRVSKSTPYRRVCRQCIADDLQTLGTSYWRVSHQLPLASYCLHHEIKLCMTDIPLRGNANCSQLLLPHEVELTPSLINLDEGLQKDLTLRSRSVLQSKSGSRSTRSDYRRAAQQLGFARPCGALAARALSSEFESFFGIQYLKDMGCSVSERSLWPALLCSENKEFEASPTKHLLLSAFLDRYERPALKQLRHYKSRKVRPVDYSALDGLVAARLQSKFGDVPLMNADIKIRQILDEVEARSLYSHHRSQLPVTTGWIERFKLKKHSRLGADKETEQSEKLPISRD